MLSDSFKDLVMKKNLFVLGKDIWNESKGVHVKKKMLDTNEVEAKKVRLVSGYIGLYVILTVCSHSESNFLICQKIC